MRQLELLFALTAAAALTACGGGGDASTPPPPPPPPASQSSSAPPAPEVGTNGTLQTSVAAATYPDARRRAAFDELNAARRGAGAGLLAQNAALDTTTGDHVNYLAANGFDSADSPHDETSGLPGYTGATPFTRMTAAGYQFSFAGEVIGDIGSSSATSDCVGDLLDTVYHAIDMLGHETDVGIAFGTGATAGMCTIDLAKPLMDGAAQIPPSGAVVTYPYDGQTVASGTFRVANESPRAPASLLPAATAGTPVLVGLRNQDFLVSRQATVTTFALANAGGAAVPAVILAGAGITGANVHADPNIDADSGFVALVPTSPLPAGRYTVTLQAAVTGGRPLATTTWSFSVASQQ
jgi:uncharacterized protein YkwD